MNLKSHESWIKEIGKYTGEKDAGNVVRYALSYTLQSLRAGEDMHRFRWDTPGGYDE